MRQLYVHSTPPTIHRNRYSYLDVESPFSFVTFDTFDPDSLASSDPESTVNTPSVAPAVISTSTSAAAKVKAIPTSQKDKKQTNVNLDQIVKVTTKKRKAASKSKFLLHAAFAEMKKKSPCRTLIAGSLPIILQGGSLTIEQQARFSIFFNNFTKTANEIAFRTQQILDLYLSQLPSDQFRDFHLNNCFKNAKTLVRWIIALVEQGELSDQNRKLLSPEKIEENSDQIVFIRVEEFILNKYPDVLRRETDWCTLSNEAKTTLADALAPKLVALHIQKVLQLREKVLLFNSNLAAEVEKIIPTAIVATLQASESPGNFLFMNAFLSLQKLLPVSERFAYACFGSLKDGFLTWHESAILSQLVNQRLAIGFNTLANGNLIGVTMFSFESKSLF